MSKSIKVSKISLDSLFQLKAAGFHVEFEQITLTPSNPKNTYHLADTISVLNKSYKKGLDIKVAKPTIAKSNPALKDIKKKMGVLNEKG